MKWIVFSKEKPQKVGSYLVTHTTDSGRYYVDYDYWTVCDKFKYHPTDVIAWMPFPEPFNADRKTEPQTDYPCDTCANKGDHDGECRNCVSDSEVIKWKKPSHYKPKDEPQCEVCINYGVEFTDNDSFDTCLANECHYEPKTEPQTERSE